MKKCSVYQNDLGKIYLAKTDEQLSEETLRNLEALGYVDTSKKKEDKKKQ